MSISINGNKGSNYSFGVDLEKPKIQKSGLDLSYVSTFTAEEGKIYPCFYEYLVGNDSGKLVQTSLVRVLNTPVVPLASRQRVFTHTYMTELTGLWAEAETFFTKGRTFSDSKKLADKKVPKVSLANSAFAPGKLMDMLGFVNVDYSAPGRTEVPIFKPMFYLRVVRDYYINQRIFATWLEYMASDDSVNSGERLPSDIVDYGFIKDWFFPADDHEFRWNSKVFDNWFYDKSISESVKNATFDWLFGDLWYRYWTDDYFTTAQLVPIYGEVPYFMSNLEGTFKALVDSSSVGSNLSFLSMNSNGLSKSTFSITSDILSPDYTRVVNSGMSTFMRVDNRDPDYSAISMKIDNVDKDIYGLKRNDSLGNASIAEAFNKSLKVVGSTNMTMDSLRNLACATQILQKLSKTDGSFREFNLTFFGTEPEFSVDMHPKYIGGSYQPIEFTEVVNTANAQGDISGRGVSAGQDELGSYFSKSHGLIMSFMSIVPDTYYSQGWKKQDLYEVSDEFFLPEKSGLGMEAILNDEIFYTGDENGKLVFGYQNRLDYMRYRQNEVHGKVSDPNNESYPPYIEQRRFKSCPTLTPSFLSMKGTIEGAWRSDKTDGVSYLVQILNRNIMYRPLPYSAEVNNLGF